MTGIAGKAASKAAALLSKSGGLAEALAEVAMAEEVAIPPLEARQIAVQNVAAEVAERALEIRYPTFAVYCEKAVNAMREKFRTFSGRVTLVAEVRASQDRLEGLERTTQVYADAVMQVLEASRGDWGDGMYYAGAYEVEFGAVKRGGRGFLQAARLRFEIEVGR